MENRYDPLPILLKHARDAFRGPDVIAREWKDLNFTAPPDFARAVAEYDTFVDAVQRAGGDVRALPGDASVSIDSIYVRDAAVVCDRGVILCRMGKHQRATEPVAQETALRALGFTIAGRIEPPGQVEGGDVAWLDARTVAVGRGYRTNDDGIRQLRSLLGDSIDEMITVALPHWRGPGDVFHLMSIISPIDNNLAVVYSPLLPVPFREMLLGRGTELVEVPDEEFDTMGANVLAVTRRRCVMVKGNPLTRARLESAGAHVIEYEGLEISLKGGGGPTCLTQPMAMSW